MSITIVDPLQWVRSRSQQFFPSGTVDPIGLLSYLMADVVELGRGTCTIRRDGDWWFVGSDVNWLRHDQYEVKDLFDNVVTAPNHGEHSMRAEILVKAFAKNVSVLLDGELLCLAGAELPKQVLDRVLGTCQSLYFSL